MRHSEFKKLFSLVLDNEATPQERLRVEEHLKTCSSCRSHATGLKTLSSLLKEWKDENPSPDLEQQFKNKFDTRRQKEGDPMRVKKYFEVVLSVIVVVVLAAGAQKYLTRGMQANLQGALPVVAELGKSIQVTGALKTSADDIGDQYEPYHARRGVYAQKSLEARESTRYAFSSPDLARGRPSSMIANGLTVKSLALLGERDDSTGAVFVRECPLSYPVSQEEYNREGYSRIYENKFLDVVENPLSTFSIDVDTASYSNMRRFLNSNQMPPADAVRIEEMINYFSYSYPQPEEGKPFSVTLEGIACPWNPDHELVLVGLQGKEMDTKNLPPSNLVFLIDTSGSMQSADKLELLKRSFGLMVRQLTANEHVAIVTYAGSAGLVLDSTSGDEKQKILNAIDNLSAGGSTAGGAGIQLAYETAKKNFIANGNNRVILATDGDFNVGVSSDAELVRLIEEKRQQGIFLTVLGFGTGNYQDAKMEQLADKGNGNYYYIDTLNEGQKVMVSELGSTLFAIAKDVKIQIEFNPKNVKAYRLIGYENRMLAKEDFNDDAKDAGELGAGHTVTALYEIIPAGSVEAVLGTDELKYQKTTVVESPEVLTIKLRYKEPSEDQSKLIAQALKKDEIFIGKVSENLQFAAAVAEFGLLLRGSEYKSKASYQHVLEAARAAKGEDPFGYREEFIGLVSVAKALDLRTPSSGIQFKGETTK